MEEQPNFEEAMRKAQEGFPDGGLTELGASVTMSNEIYEAHLEVGFTPRQALYLTAVMFTNTPGAAPPLH